MTENTPGGAINITERLTTSNLATYVSRKAGRTALTLKEGSSVMTLGFFSNSQTDRERMAPIITEFITGEIAGASSESERPGLLERGQRIGRKVTDRLVERRERENWPAFSKDRSEAQRIARTAIDTDVFAASALALAHKVRHMDVSEAALDVVMAVGLVIREENEQSGQKLVPLPEQRPTPAEGAGNISA
jgi:hypothetical protein